MQQPFAEVGDRELHALAASAVVASEAAAAAAAAGGGDGLLALEQQQLWGAPWQEGGSCLYCYGCQRPLAPHLDSSHSEAAAAAGGLAAADDGPGMVLRCQLCRRLFCFECDAFIHESLHNCPGCECGGAAMGGLELRQQQQPNGKAAG